MSTPTIPTSSEDSDENSRSNAPAKGSMQLLLVEDDQLICARLETVLAQAQFDVYAVSSARAAREMMKTVVFPIVIVDRMLQDGDGISLVRELRRCHVQHRVFLMLYSALDSEGDRRDGIAAGADEYLSKRATDAELLARLRAARALVQLRSK